VGETEDGTLELIRWTRVRKGAAVEEVAEQRAQQAA
jgi:hypothetical protein